MILVNRGFAGLAAFLLLAGAAGSSSAGEIQGNAGCGTRCGDYILYLEGVGGSFSGEGSIVEFGQENKVFIPHVLPILKGSTVRIGNADPFMHNVHAYQGKKTFFNIALPFQGQTIDQAFPEAGVYTILCDAHPEMSAFIVALENPFFSKPDEEGAFVIGEVPPGTYSLVRYDAENDKTAKQQVTVGEDAVSVTF